MDPSSVKSHGIIVKLNEVKAQKVLCMLAVRVCIFKKLSLYFIKFKIPLMIKLIMSTKSESEVARLCPILCNPMDCSLPGSTTHGIFQARILEWLPFPSPGDLPDPGIKPTSPAFVGGFFTTEPPGKPQVLFSLEQNMTVLTLSSLSCWRIPWREEPGGLQSIEL